MAVYDDVKRALQEIVAPQLGEVRGEVGTLRAEMKEMRAEMDRRFGQVDAKFAEVRSEIAQLRSEMRQETNNLHTDLVRIEQVFGARLEKVELVERLTRVEERLAVASKPAPAA